MQDCKTHTIAPNAFNAAPHSCKVPGVKVLVALGTCMLEMRTPLVEALLLLIRVGVGIWAQAARSAAVPGPQIPATLGVAAGSPTLEHVFQRWGVGSTRPSARRTCGPIQALQQTADQVLPKRPATKQRLAPGGRPQWTRRPRHTPSPTVGGRGGGGCRKLSYLRLADNQVFMHLLGYLCVRQEE